jgi:hypothetical protein
MNFSLKLAVFRNTLISTIIQTDLEVPMHLQEKQILEEGSASKVPVQTHANFLFLEVRRLADFYIFSE